MSSAGSSEESHSTSGSNRSAPNSRSPARNSSKAARTRSTFSCDMRLFGEAGAFEGFLTIGVLVDPDNQPAPQRKERERDPVHMNTSAPALQRKVADNQYPTIPEISHLSNRDAVVLSRVEPLIAEPQELEMAPMDVAFK